ncbi:MAG: transposase [Spirochaetales bacterium]|nr:transposase [Spirochaetales bacterium]
MRKPRQKGFDMNQHIIMRVNRGEMIFCSPIIKIMFILVLKEAKRKFKFRLKHYCVMSNHVHLIVRPYGGEDISRMMKWISQTFAIRYNKLSGISGHVWGDRFTNIIIADSSYFNHAFDYISQNPVKAGLADKAENYFFSGLYYFIRNIFGLLDPGGYFS